MKVLQDTDIMPWGKWNDTPMQDVPAKYFHWLWTEGGKQFETKSCPVADYIKRNLDALQMENKDLIWD